MTGSTQMAARAVAKVPAYCSGWAHGLTPAQWKQCWNLGWSQPTTGAASTGTATGHYAAPALVIGIIIGLILIAMSRSGKSRTTAASS